MIKYKRSTILLVILSLLFATTFSVAGAFGQEGSQPFGSVPTQGESREQNKATEPETTETTQPVSSETNNKRVEPKAIQPEFINLERYTGFCEVSDVSPDAAAVSDAPGVATFENGNILAHNLGIAIINIPMENGDTKRCYVSVYWNYPQPKTGTITTGHNNVRLCKWGKIGNSDYTGVTLNSDAPITILKRVDDQTDPGQGLMQYIRTSSGQEGWVSNEDTTSRAMPDYCPDIAVGTQEWLDTAYNNNYQTDYTFISNRPDIVTVTKGTYTGYANQGRITGVTEGHAVITATAGTINAKSSLSVTAYTSIKNINGSVKTNCPVYRSTGGQYPSGVRQAGEALTISGKSGDYWRIGAGRYIHKNNVTIPPTSVKLNKKEITIKLKKSKKLKATVSPAIATNKNVAWKSSNKKIASVNASGKVTGKKQGFATITATTKLGKKVAKCKVTVKKTIGKNSIKGSKITNSYVYSFDNSDDSFFKSGQKMNFYMNNKDKKKLINYIYKEYADNYGYTKNDVKDIVNDSIKSSWGGSCYGMSNSIAVNRMKQINMRTYTKSDGKGYKLNKVKYPKNKKRVKSAINFYQNSQPYFNEKTEYFWKGKTSWKSGLEKIVERAKNNNLQTFSLKWSDGSGHRILIKKHVKKAGGWYWLSTYDPSIRTQKTYVKISTDFKRLKVTGWPDPVGCGSGIDFSRYKKMDIDL